MSTDNFDEVAPLQAKVVMLSAALRKMDTDCAQKVSASAMLGINCAYGYTEIAEWSRTLFACIGYFSRQDAALPCCDVIEKLAGIGVFVAEQAECSAESFGSEAEKRLDSCKKVTA